MPALPCAMCRRREGYLVPVRVGGVLESRSPLLGHREHAMSALQNPTTKTRKPERNRRQLISTLIVWCSLCLCGFILLSTSPAADEKVAPSPEAPLFSAMKYRLVGP